MSLTESETLGTVIAGFVTDEDGRLILVSQSETDTIQGGFVKDADGRLVVTHGA
jgi:hypothetical protein